MKRPDKKSIVGTPVSQQAGPGIDDNDTAVFLSAVRDVAPLPASNKVPSFHQHPRPIPRKIPEDEQSAPDDSLSDHISLAVEAGDEWSFLRPGVSRQTLRRLRRGYWPIRAQLDLHGYNREEARIELGAFLDASNARGFRCVRVIHGKGLSSKSNEPVLKARVGGWLSQRNDVLVFCQARAEEGGSGAVLVLLKIREQGNAK